MNKRIKELQEDIKQLELQDQFIVSQIAQKIMIVDHLESEIEELEWQRESLRTMLLEDEATLSELNEDIAK